MRFANVAGRASVVVENTVIDLAEATDGRIGPDPMDIYRSWDDALQVSRGLGPSSTPLNLDQLGCPVPMPRQVFAIGLNYRRHAEEAGMAVPTKPATFTKFPSSLAGPFDDVTVIGDATDWEVELVVVIGRTADRVAHDDAWAYVAGFTVGQDISDRYLQMAAGAQFSLGKSHRGFGPMGPWVVSVDEFDDPSDLSLGCSIDGELVQDARTSDLIFDVPALIEELSSVLTLWPGDVIFTGTPSGVGMGYSPARALAPGNVIETWVEGIGTMRNRCV